MSAQDANSSGITLPEIGGLMKDMIDKLLGKNGRRWLVWWKHFLRKENPWLPTKKFFSFRAGAAPLSMGDVLISLNQAGLPTPEFIRENADHPYFKPFYSELENYKNFPEFSLVAIRVSDLLSSEERATFTYSDILKRVEDMGFTPCDVLNGLIGVRYLVEDQTQTLENKPLSFVICSEAFKQQGIVGQSLVTGIIWAGKRDNQGSINLETVDHPDYSLRFQSNPDCLMIFMSVIE